MLKALLRCNRTRFGKICKILSVPFSEQDHSIYNLDVYLAFAIMRHVVVRIYQGKVVNGYFINQSKGEESQMDDVLSALKDTHVFFQDAVNYHLAALAKWHSRVISRLRQDSRSSSGSVGYA